MSRREIRHPIVAVVAIVVIAIALDVAFLAVSAR